MNNRYYLILLAVVLLGAGSYFGYERYSAVPKPQACTMEALICPDGSSVGRTGPNCAFAPCPQVGPDVPLDWLTATGTVGFTYRYPREWELKYVEPTDWPPLLKVRGVPFTCAEPRNIDGRTFCITEIKEGAAGSTYTQYTYAFALAERTAYLSETFRTPQCANFSPESAFECKVEQDEFSVDKFMAQIAGTVLANQ
ncbi:MAG TPA: hypothetical protein VJG48_01835 [Candidatus Paceibacterota bacterium]